MDAAGKMKRGGVPALGWWLMAVGTVRVGHSWPGFFSPAVVGSATYGGAHVTSVHGRTFAVWTLLSGTLCFLCAFNLGNKPLYAATFLSILYAYGHLLIENLVYHTTTSENLLMYTVIAGTDIDHVDAAPVELPWPSSCQEAALIMLPFRPSTYRDRQKDNVARKSRACHSTLQVQCTCNRGVCKL
ncbi:hypothetical protein EJB05_05233, partial [Eragrostis curvula]